MFTSTRHTYYIAGFKHLSKRILVMCTLITLDIEKKSRNSIKNKVFNFLSHESKTCDLVVEQ